LFVLALLLEFLLVGLLARLLLPAALLGLLELP
jgi:hypothetical protein